MAGSTALGKFNLDATLGLYVDRQVLLMPAPSSALTLRYVYRQVQNYQFPTDAARKQYTQVVQLRDTPDSKLDEILWATASSQTARHNLPLAFFTFGQMAADGKERVVFWYARLAPGPWLLRQFQHYAR